MPSSTQKAKQVKRDYEKKWLSIEGVTAVGVGLINDKDIGIIISVKSTLGKIRSQIPSEIEGIPIQIQETGEFKAQ